jgi:hypothetical protein
MENKEPRAEHEDGEVGVAVITMLGGENGGGPPQFTTLTRIQAANK